MLGHFGSVSTTLYALLALLLLPSSISDSIPLAEFDALFDLFNATDGSNWLWKDTTTYGPKWNFSNPNVNPCIDKWQGLNCTTSPYYIHDIKLGSYNLAGSIPNSVGNFSQLYRFDVNTNSLTGTIPPSLGDLDNLCILLLYTNHLTGSLPESLGNNRRLQMLEVSTNLLVGSIPSSFGHLTALQHLETSLNGLTGTIPSTLGQLCDLQYLRLQNNFLRGSIPNMFSCMVALKVVNLANNSLDGTISRSVCNAHKLATLSLDTNKLTGPIPNCIGNLTLLSSWNLFANILSGTIPSSIASMTLMNTLNLAGNALSGTLPDVFAAMKAMPILNLQGNRLSGQLPSSIGEASALQKILFDVNDFSGTIPPSYGALSDILLLMLSNSHLSGTIPSALCQLSSVEYFDLEGNLLSGGIPACIDGMLHVQSLYLFDNHLSGPIPSSLGALSWLQELKLYSNHFSGALPGSLQHLSNMSVLLLSDNRFSGTLDGVFNASLQILLTTVTLSDNQLTGALPTELFRLPRLQTVDVVSNCFRGALPSNVCSADHLVTLASDGQRSASTCRVTLLPGLSHAYRVSDPWTGTLPSCLFNMTSLTTLHLSGNGYTGSLPPSAAISPLLSDLSLSHNLLSGTIPDNFQLRVWSNLDLSYNRLTGTLRRSFAAGLRSNATLQGEVALSLENNRLSGVIPSSLLDLSNVSVLSSNLFTCRVDRSDLPRQDSAVDHYQCGSSSFNVPYYIWLALTACVGACAVYCKRRKYYDYIQAWWVADHVVLQQYLQLRKVLYGLVKVSCKVCVYVLTVVCPLYVCLSVYETTTVFQYAYTLSAGFLSGPTAFALIMVALLALVLLFVTCFVSDLCLHNRSDQRSVSVLSEQPRRSATERVLIYTSFIAINFTVVVGVNAAYVYVALYGSGDLLLVVQVLLSFFKFAWNSVCGAQLVRTVSQYLTGGELAAVELYMHEFTTVQLAVALFNNIAIPCLVVAAISPNCFYHAFVHAPRINAQYSFQDCVATFSTTTDSCSGTEFTDMSTSYSPPFAYSYQCSATFVTYYAPAFVYLCITATFLQPALQVLLCRWYAHAGKGTRWHTFLTAFLSRLDRLTLTADVLAPSQRSVLHPVLPATSLLNSALTYVGILLTFGAVFPPLAVALFVTICAIVASTRLSVGRLVTWVREDELRVPYLSVIDAECRDVTANTILLIRALRLIVLYACCFYTLFLFDTLGDKVGIDDAYWVLIVMPLSGIGINLALRVYTLSHHPSSICKDACVKGEVIMETELQGGQVQENVIIVSESPLHASV